MALRSFGYFISFFSGEWSNTVVAVVQIFSSVFLFIHFLSLFFSFICFLFFHAVWFPFLLLLLLCFASTYFFQLILFHPCFFFSSFNFKLKVFENYPYEVARSCFLSVASILFHPRGANSKTTSIILFFCFWLKTPNITRGGMWGTHIFKWSFFVIPRFLFLYHFRLISVRYGG